ncbi:hypothetical protein EBT31_00675 [bacterium]|nr:hypothetical protein [bacterium]
MATVLSGTSGALYYTPAGTSVTTLAAGAFPSTGANITVGSYLGFKVNDPVTLTYPAGAVTTNAIAAGPYFVKTYVASTGIMTLSSTAGGSAVTATAAPSGFGANFASIEYTAPAVVGSVREWSFEITRSEIDVTTIGQEVGQYAPFRTYITGFADGSGSATVYTTDDDTSLSSRMIEDVIQRTQAGAEMKLYIDRIVSSGTVNDTTSRSITVPVILTSASLTVNPDDGQSVEIAFRPSEAPTFDLAKS